MSDEQPEESLDDIMASMEVAALKKSKLSARYPMSVGPKAATNEPAPLSAAQPVVEEAVHNMTPSQWDQLVEQVEPQSNPVQVDRYAEYDAEPFVRNIPMPTGWVLPLAALLMCVLVFGGLGLYVWSHTP